MPYSNEKSLGPSSKIMNLPKDKMQKAFPTVLRLFDLLRPVPVCKCLLRIMVLASIAIAAGYLSNWLSISSATSQTENSKFPEGFQFQAALQVRWLEENSILFQDYDFIKSEAQRDNADISLRDRLFGPVPVYQITVPLKEDEPVGFVFARSRFCPFLVRTYYSFKYGHFDSHGADTYLTCFGLAICVDSRHTLSHYHYKKGP